MEREFFANLRKSYSSRSQRQQDEQQHSRQAGEDKEESSELDSTTSVVTRSKCRNAFNPTEPSEKRRRFTWQNYGEYIFQRVGVAWCEDEEEAFGGTAGPSQGSLDGSRRDESAYGTFLERSRGCALVDCGASKSCVSKAGMNLIRRDKADHGEPPMREPTPSTVKFKFGGSGGGSAKWEQ